MLDITFDITALFILLLGAICLFYRRKMDKKMLRWLTVLLMLGVWFSLYSIFLYAVHTGILRKNTVLQTAAAYLIAAALAVYPYFMYRFLSAYTRHERGKRKLLLFPAAAAVFLILAVNPWTGILFGFQADGTIYPGKYFFLLNLNWICYFLICVVFLLRNHKVLGTWHSAMFMVLVLLCDGSFLMQAVLPEPKISTLGMAFSLTLLIIYFYYVDDTLDRLTGICGKDGFYRETAAMLAEDTRQEYVLIRSDIRHLREINEKYGFETGNRLLMGVADELREQVGTAGTMGRLSGDNFVTCLPKNYFQEILTEASTQTAVKAGLEPHQVNLYFGIYTIQDKTMPVDMMCDRAEYAMNRIKENYLQHFSYFDENMEEDISSVRFVEDNMYTALQQRQFQVYYQPIYELETQKIASAEALIRWKHPEKGMISPGQFIPLFERNGFIGQLEEYVFQQVCRDLNKWRRQGLHFVPVSINLSRVEFYDTEHMRRMCSILEKSGVPSQSIHVEVTESAFTQGTEQLLSVLELLRREGIKILMDDFGSGYSSLNMFKNMPVDILKIDMRFLEKDDAYKRGREILYHIIKMAQAVNIPIIVEGVETQEQAGFLRQQNCDQVQGYLFARPMCEKDYAELIS